MNMGFVSGMISYFLSMMITHSIVTSGILSFAPIPVSWLANTSLTFLREFRISFSELMRTLNNRIGISHYFSQKSLVSQTNIYNLAVQINK